VKRAAAISDLHTSAAAVSDLDSCEAAISALDSRETAISVLDSREAAKECSPQRKLWVPNGGNDQAPEGAKE
jgi:hypothetical protein